MYNDLIIDPPEEDDYENDSYNKKFNTAKYEQNFIKKQKNQEKDMVDNFYDENSFDEENEDDLYYDYEDNENLVTILEEEDEQSQISNSVQSYEKSQQKSSQQQQSKQSQNRSQFSSEFMRQNKRLVIPDFSDDETVSGISSSYMDSQQQEDDDEYYNQDYDQDFQAKNLKQNQYDHTGKQMEMKKNFENIVNQQTKLQQDRDKIQKLQKKMNYKLSLNPQQIKDIIDDMDQNEDDYIAKKATEKRYKHKFEKKDLEALLHDIQFFKKQHNEDQAQIKILKVELRKLVTSRNSEGNLQQKQKTHNNSLLSTQMTDSQYSSNSDLQQENQLLKKDISVLLQDHKNEISKLKKLNLELQKGYLKQVRGLTQKSEYKVTDEQIIKKNQTQEKLISNLRLKIEQHNKKYSLLQQQMQKQNEELIRLSQKRNEKTVIKQDKQIIDLQNKIELNDKEKEELKVTYGLDNQLKILFPKNCNLLGKIMNGVLTIEELEQDKEGKAFARITDTTKPIHKFLKQGVDRMTDYIKFYKDKKKTQNHSNYKWLAKAQIQEWSQNPDIMTKEINLNQKDIKKLKDEILLLLSEKEQLESTIQDWKKKYDIINKRNDIVEQKLDYDRVKLARQITLFYSSQEKGEEMECFRELKEYVDIIETPLCLMCREKKQKMEQEEQQKRFQEEEKQRLKEIEDRNKKQQRTQNYLKPTKSRQERLNQNTKK